MKQIDAALLQKMLIGGAKRLEANKEYINELNVFPVPDGDTGTNMTMTALAAAKEVGNAAEVTVFACDLCPVVSALLFFRQIFRFHRHIAKQCLFPPHTKSLKNCHDRQNDHQNGRHTSHHPARSFFRLHIPTPSFSFLLPGFFFFSQNSLHQVTSVCLIGCAGTQGHKFIFCCHLYILSCILSHGNPGKHFSDIRPSPLFL